MDRPAAVLVRHIDKRTIGWKRRNEALNKKTDILVQMTDRAWRSGIDAAFILFDSWFAHDDVISKIYNIGYGVICRLKRGRVKYTYHGKPYIKSGEQFGDRYLYKWWKKACINFGIEDVDLYGGTRHSATISLRENFTPEQIKQATMHSTNKAFERYFRFPNEEVKVVYEYLGQVIEKPFNKLNFN